jgi:hypothetical protein
MLWVMYLLETLRDETVGTSQMIQADQLRHTFTRSPL